MKRGKFLPRIAVVVCLLCLVLSAAAQTKKRRPVRKSTTTTTATAAANAAEVKAEAEKVAAQIVNVTKFMYVLGGIAHDLQDVNASTKNKQAVITTIGNLRAGLNALEAEFQGKPLLVPYYSQIQGISDISATAEDQASAGQFVNSGKTLLQVIEKLSNTLVAMP